MTIETNTEKEDQIYIRKHWEALAVIAYAGYLEHGRGAVCILHDAFVASFFESPTPAQVTLDPGVCAYYVTDIGKVKKKRAVWRRHVQIHTYHPEHDLVAIIRQGQEVRSYLVRTPGLSPAAIYAARQAGNPTASDSAAEATTSPDLPE